MTNQSADAHAMHMQVRGMVMHMQCTYLCKGRKCICECSWCPPMLCSENKERKVCERKGRMSVCEGLTAVQKRSCCSLPVSFGTMLKLSLIHI
eukprot:15466624-Alexandrium_andersonii.AAC.3